LSFLSTQYKGVAELGLIAGIGMLVAFAATITLLPALLASFNPPGEPSRMGFAEMAPFDHFLARYRIAIVVGTLVLILGASPLLPRMRFDFDPIHLQNQQNEAVQTYRELATTMPEVGVDAINLIATSLTDVAALEQKLSGLSDVAGTRSVLDLIPADQDAKRTAIHGAASALDPVLDGGAGEPAPTDAEIVAAMRQAATDLDTLGYYVSGAAAAAAERLSSQLARPRRRRREVPPICRLCRGCTAATRPRGTAQHAATATGDDRNLTAQYPQRLDRRRRSRARRDPAKG
jgi:uncharacterized membrane protein YdfJ with MMPL/SSD domain